jgi:hypothetical protein
VGNKSIRGTHSDLLPLDLMPDHLDEIKREELMGSAEDTDTAILTQLTTCQFAKSKQTAKSIIQRMMTGDLAIITPTMTKMTTTMTTTTTGLPNQADYLTT